MFVTISCNRFDTCFTDVERNITFLYKQQLSAVSTTRVCQFRCAPCAFSTASQLQNNEIVLGQVCLAMHGLFKFLVPRTRRGPFFLLGKYKFYARGSGSGKVVSRQHALRAGYWILETRLRRTLLHRS